MREVSEFVVVFPGRFLSDKEGRHVLLDMMHREYPHYKFEAAAGRQLDEDFHVIPVMGRVGDGEFDDPERVYLCKPLDPKVIPDLVGTLQVYDGLSEPREARNSDLGIQPLPSIRAAS